MSPNCGLKCHGGPGYASPADAIKGPREEVLFVTAPNAADGPDAIFTVDVNPESDTFCQVNFICKVDFFSCLEEKNTVSKRRIEF